MSKELAVKNNSFEMEFQQVKEMAKAAQDSGLYPGIGGEAKIFMILMAAKELDIPPMMALNRGINIIKGSVELSSRLMSFMIRRAGHSIVVKESNRNVCILQGRRRDNGDTFEAQFSIEDAKNAGLMGKDNWKNFTEDMLFARAMSRLARRMFADAIGMSYVKGEILGEGEDREEIKKELAPPEPQDADVEIIETIDDKQIFGDFLKKVVPDGDMNDEQWANAYLEAYALHHKKSMTEAIQAYQDIEKFKQHCSTWKTKQIAKEKEA